MTQRFAHMTPGLWALWVVSLGLAVATASFGVHGFLTAQQGTSSWPATILALVTVTVLWVFIVWNRRRRKEWEHQA